VSEVATHRRVTQAVFAMTILEAMDDPALFGPFFNGDTWKPWRAFLAAVFGLPMDDEQLALYRQFTGRQDPPAGPVKEAALVIGRRGGKSRIMALIAVYLAMFGNYEPYLAPGEMATIACIAADKKQARTILRYISGMLKVVPMLADMIEGETAESITLSNQVQIEVHTASFRVTRGYTFAAVLADETAFWRSEDTVNPDTEIFAALRPGLGTIPSSILLNASSPYRKRGVLYAAYSKHYGVDGARVLVWQATTLEMHPDFDASIVEQAYEDDPEAASAEYGAQFRNDLSDFVSRDVVNAVTIMGRFEIAPIGGLNYVGFVDPSGGSGSDSMTLAIAHREGDRCILDAVREVRPPFSPDQTTDDFATLLKSYRLREVTGDRYAGEFPRERFRFHGINYALTEQPKSDIYRDFLPVLNSGRAELLNLPRLASQLCNLERRTARSGRDSIDHPPGQHDDVANAVAGALLLAGKPAPRPARTGYVNFIGR
jgi:hypothetical protein